jgi:hypothetical protein
MCHVSNILEGCTWTQLLVSLMFYRIQNVLTDWQKITLYYAFVYEFLAKKVDVLDLFGILFIHLCYMQ